VHIFDKTESRAEPWRGCPFHGGSNEDGNECLLFGNRLSSSLIWTGHSQTYGGYRKGGVIFTPSPEFTRVLCIYGSDGGTRHGGEFDGCGNTFCDSDADGWCDGKPHRPDKLGQVLEWFATAHRDFNEVVVDAAFHSQNLPWSVEAILDDEDAHRKFLEAYQDEGVTSSSHPLLHFDPDDHVQPFRTIGRGG